MKYLIAFTESGYVVKRFNVGSELEANNIFSIFLKEEIKKHSRGRLFLKRVN